MRCVSCTDVSNCDPITEFKSALVAHMYDIWVSNNDLLVYTDWKNKSVNMLSLSTGALLRPLATGLMRPSQLLFVGTDAKSCTSWFLERSYCVLGVVAVRILLHLRCRI